MESRWLSVIPRDSLLVRVDDAVTRVGGRLALEVVFAPERGDFCGTGGPDAFVGFAEAMEFRFRLETVEIWRGRCLLESLDRDRLRNWLSEPSAPWVLPELTLSRDGGSRRMAVAVPGAQAWVFSPLEHQTLLERV